ncbi:MAG: UDP-N-acetylglucosamine 2-epimerase [Christensenellales bacterium]
MKGTILILYQNGMYDQSAKAIEDFIAEDCKDYEVVSVEQDRFSYFCTAKIEKELYKASARLFPLLNRLVGPVRIPGNKKTEEIKPTVQQNKETEVKIKYRKIDNVLKRFCPDVVLCTSPKSHDKALKARQKLGMNMPIYAITTDYCFNSDFINPLSDGYFVQNQQVAQAMLASGVESDKILVAGTPIKEVANSYDRQSSFEKYGLDASLPVIVMVGGRYGCDYLKDAYTVLSEYYRTVNIVVVTSGSKSLKNYINTYSKNKSIDRNVSIVDYPDDMQQLYSIATILVTSPTAGITREAIACGIPMVLIKPMNAVERGNYAYLTSQSLAFCGAGKHQLLSSVLSLLNNSEEYDRAVQALTGREENTTAKVCSTLTDRAAHHRQSGHNATENTGDKTDD